MEIEWVYYIVTGAYVSRMRLFKQTHLRVSRHRHATIRFTEVLHLISQCFCYLFWMRLQKLERNSYFTNSLVSGAEISYNNVNAL